MSLDDITVTAAHFDENVPSIDLHEFFSVQEALEQLERELFLMYKKRERLCRIIYGVGEGILRGAVVEALKKNPMIKEFREEESAASCLVVL